MGTYTTPIPHLVDLHALKKAILYRGTIILAQMVKFENLHSFCWHLTNTFDSKWFFLAKFFQVS